MMSPPRDTVCPILLYLVVAGLSRIINELDSYKNQIDSTTLKVLARVT